MATTNKTTLSCKQGNRLCLLIHYAPQLSDPSSPQLFTPFYNLLLNTSLMEPRVAINHLTSGKDRAEKACWGLNRLKFSQQQQPGMQGVTEKFSTTPNSARSKGTTGFLPHQDWMTRTAISTRIPWKSRSLPFFGSNINHSCSTSSLKAWCEFLKITRLYPMCAHTNLEQSWHLAKTKMLNLPLWDDKGIGI